MLDRVAMMNLKTESAFPGSPATGEKYFGYRRLRSEAMTIEAGTISNLLAAMIRDAGHSRGSCTGASEEPCPNGCWFIFAETGCKQAHECSHCHQEVCCLLADLKRKELRKQHSRMRPSKKKRDSMKRVHEFLIQSEDTSSDTVSTATAGWETSHSAVCVTPPAHPSPTVAERDVQTLLELLRAAVEI